jgi:hypothetical protein
MKKTSPITLCALLVAAAASCGGDEESQGRDAILHPFRADSPWNMPIGTEAEFESETDPPTADLLATELRGVVINVWMNAEDFSHPISLAEADDPLATMTDYNDDSRSASYRIPEDAVIAAGTDRHMHVVDPTRTYIDEAWDVTRLSATEYTCGRHEQVDLYGTGVGPQNGTRAYGGSAIGGLIRAWEVDPSHPAYTGAIRHALAMSLDYEQFYYSSGESGYDERGYGTALGYVWPATEQDWYSETTYRGNIPMGSYFAIPPEVDVAALGLSPEGVMIARAAQDYGVYVADHTDGAVVFFAEPTVPRSFIEAVLNAPSWDAQDLAVIRAQLRRVTNSSETQVNGPGARRVPMSPELVR